MSVPNTRRLAHFWTGEAGNVALVFAFLLPAVVGGLGLAVETGYWYYNDLKLQSIADAAAYDGAVSKVEGASSAEIVNNVTASASGNGFIASDGDIAVDTPPIDGSHQVNQAVEVVLHRRIPRLLSAIFVNTPVTVAARAVAEYYPESDACLLALSPTASSAALFSGSSTLNLDGCSVMSDSTAADAVKVQGSAAVNVSCLVAVGGISVGSGSITTDCSKLVSDALPVPDPFKSIAAPTPDGFCQNPNASNLQPGTYCNGLTLKGNVTLQPGVYYIEGGNFRINANADVSGSGVTIYLGGTATVSINGTASVNLSAPTTGTYAGILFFGDRGSSGLSSTFNGTAGSLLTGAIYMPTQNVQYLGNFSGNGGCTQVVGWTVAWSGNATVSQDCSSLGMGKINSAARVSLVE